MPSQMLWYLEPRICIFKIPYFGPSSEPTKLGKSFDIDLKE